jgi:hypothetical protein
MRCSTVRDELGLLLAAALLATSACATTSTREIELDPAAVEAEKAQQRQLALQRQMTYQKRLSDLAYPILASATPLCGDDASPHLGVRFANRHVYEDEWREAAERALALGDTIQVVTVTDSSAADRAGLEPGDRLVRVDGWAVPAGEEAVEALSERLDTALEDAGEAIRIVHGRGDERRTAEVTPDVVCDYPVQVLRASRLNAFADGDAIYVTTTMMRFADDDELSVVLAHELAHNAMGHIEAQQQNAILGGILGALADIAAATQGYNTGGAYAAQGAELGSMSHSQDFEREADYVGLYAMALAGLPLDGAPQFWRQMAQENPETIDFAHTHPTSAARFLRMEKAVDEIHRKQEEGVPLRPEMEDEDEEEVGDDQES